MVLIRTKMLQRLQDGADAVTLSIEKWQDIINNTGEDRKALNCALCETNTDCAHCLLASINQRCSQTGSAYDQWWRHQQNTHAINAITKIECPVCTHLATAMLNALLTLQIPDVKEVVAMTYDYSALPEHMQSAMRLYVEEGYQPGRFLTAVLSNDLAQAVQQADNINKGRLPDYVRWLINNAPSTCWGTPAKVSAWVLEHYQRKNL